VIQVARVFNDFAASLVMLLIKSRGIL